MGGCNEAYPKTFAAVDDEWFRGIADDVWGLEAGMDPAEAVRPRADSSKGLIDLSCRNGITFFDLANLYLLIDLAAARYGSARIRFSGLGPMPEGPRVMPIDEYNAIRRSGRTPAEREAEYAFSRSIYRFLSFCHHYGELFGAFEFERRRGNVQFEGISPELLASLHEYSGIRKGQHPNIFGLMPIHGEAQVDCFREEDEIRKWQQSLAQDLRNVPIFRDGEFSRIIGYELALNILQHAGNQWRRRDGGALGVVAMRVIVPDQYESQRPDFHHGLDELLSGETSPLGVLEVCIADRGEGIVRTLRPTLERLYSAHGLHEAEDLDVISFAFDEIGSRKPSSTRTGGAHALNRILNCVTKYHGALRIRSGTKEVLFDASKGAKIDRGREGLGYAPTGHVSRPYPFPGTQTQLLLPLAVPHKRTSVLVRRGMTTSKSDTAPMRIHVCSAQRAMKHGIQRGSTADLARSLNETPSSEMIAYDLGHDRLTELQIAQFLRSQEAVISTHVALGLNLAPSLLHTLREIDRSDPESEHGGAARHRLFLDLLTCNHRVIPIMDTEGRVCWLGLGRYPLDECLNALLASGKALTEEAMLSKVAMSDISGGLVVKSPEEMAEGLRNYLNTNDLFFEHRGEGWRSRISRGDFERAQREYVSTQAHRLLNRCWHPSSRDREGMRKNDKRLVYKLPSHPEFAHGFFQLTPLLQDDTTGHAVAEWISVAVMDWLSNCSETVTPILVSVTAPAALLARRIAEVLEPDYRVHLVDMGYLAHLEEKGIVGPETWKSPAVIVADVVGRGTTAGSIVRYLEDTHAQVRILGVVAIHLLSRELQGERPRVMFRENLEFGGATLPFFGVRESLIPGTLEQDAVLGPDARFEPMLVEPYSLELYRYGPLRRVYREGHPRTAEARERFHLLAAPKEGGGRGGVDALRYGHWAYQSHHFRALTCIRELLQDDRCAGQITATLRDLCSQREIDCILVPLHSHIGDLLPRLLSSLRIISGRHVGHAYCVAVKSLTHRPFYVLPQSVKDMIAERTSLMTGSSRRRGLRFLILDDAAASGRTVDTILRALVLAARNAWQSASRRSPIDEVNAYVMIDRQGMARGTVMTGIRRVSLIGDGEWLPKAVRSRDSWAVFEAKQTSRAYKPENDPGFTFQFLRWLDLDLPVDEADSCPLCQEHKDLKKIQEMITAPQHRSLLAALIERRGQLAPRGTETEAFVEGQSHPLPGSVSFADADLQVTTVEAAMWQFLYLISHGCPVYVLLKDYQSLRETLSSLEKDEDDRNLRFLLMEMAREFFRRWDLLEAQFCTKEWVNIVRDEIENPSADTKWLLSAAGRAYATACVCRGEARSDLFELFRLTRNRVDSPDHAATGEETEETKQTRASLIVGSQLFYLNYKYYSSDDSVVARERELTRLEQALGPDAPVSKEREGDFASSVLVLMQETLRHARHPGVHGHLVPESLRRLLEVHESKEGLSREELGSIAGHLASLHLALGVVGRSHAAEALRGVAAQKATRALQSLVRRLCLRLEASSRLTKEVQDAARQLWNLYPEPGCCELYDWLELLNKRVDHLFQDLSASRPVSVPLHFACPESVRASTILVPPGDGLVGILANWLTPPQKDGGEATEFLLPESEWRACLAVGSLSSDRTGTYVPITLYTNHLAHREGVDQAIWAGSGTKDFSKDEFKELGICLKDVGKGKTGPDNRQYAVRFDLQFRSAFPPAPTQGDQK